MELYRKYRALLSRQMGGQSREGWRTDHEGRPPFRVPDATSPITQRTWNLISRLVDGWSL